MPSTTENTCFGSWFAPRTDVGAFMLSDVGCMLTHVVHPVRSRPLKSVVQPSAAKSGADNASKAAMKPVRAMVWMRVMVVSL